MITNNLYDCDVYRTDYSFQDISYCYLYDIMYTPKYSKKRFDEVVSQMEKQKQQYKNPNKTVKDRENIIHKLEKITQKLKIYYAISNMN